MIIMFLINGMYLSFCFMSCSEPPLGISGVGSFPVWSGGSQIAFQLFRCRNLALNRDVFPTLEAGMWGCQHRGCPYATHMSIHPICPYAPYPCTSVCSPIPYVPPCHGDFEGICLVFLCLSVHPLPLSL